jgi:hypothetical protein
MAKKPAKRKAAPKTAIIQPVKDTALGVTPAKDQERIPHSYVRNLDIPVGPVERPPGSMLKKPPKEKK